MKDIRLRRLLRSGFAVVLACLLLLPLLPLQAAATVIPNTSACEPLEITLSEGGKVSSLLDASYSTSIKLNAGSEITVHTANKLHGIYLIWDSLVPEWEMKIGENSYTYGKSGFLHEYIELPEESDTVTIVVPDGSVFNGQDGSVEGGMRVADICNQFGIGLARNRFRRHL